MSVFTFLVNKMHEKSDGRREAKEYATGFSDNLEPLEALDLSKDSGLCVGIVRVSGGI